MQTSVYNNPMFAQGLSGLVKSFIGDPAKTAQSELLASEALLNNQTAQYREAIGDTGLSGDLASMMIRALQAGPQYSGNAPKIGDAAIRMGAMGFGSPELTPSGPIAAMMMQAMSGGGRRSGGRRSGGGRSRGRKAATPTAGGYDWSKLSVTDRNATLAAVRRAIKNGQTPEGMTEAQAAALIAQNPGSWPNAQEALLAITDPDNFEREMQEVVTNEAGTALSRLFGLDDGVPDAVEQQPVGDWRFKGAAADPGSAGAAIVDQTIAEARNAIAKGADPAAVKKRLADMGVDPSNL